VSLDQSPARQTAPRRKRGRKPREVLGDTLDRWGTPEEAAAILGVAVQSLAHDRVNGALGGFPYLKLRHGVRYHLGRTKQLAEAREITPPGRRGRAA
jgi:hypothetical protein